MSTRPVPQLSWLMLVTGAIALWGLDQNVFVVGAVFKTLTSALLFVVLGRPQSRLQRKVRLGLVFALIGDVALLGKEGLWFQLGLGAFLVTHLCYIAGFLPYAKIGLRPIVTGVLAVVAALTTFTLAYPVASEKGVAIPVAIYSAVLSGTVVFTNATIGGKLRHAFRIALGALFFYVADTSIAVKVFIPTIVLPHPVLFTTGLYWVGQYLIVAGVRGGER